MNPARRRIDEAEVSIQIGRFQFRPLPIFLDQVEQRHQLRPVHRAPFRQHDHRLIVGSLGVFLRHLQYRQAHIPEQVILERLRSGIRADVHVPDDRPDFVPKLNQLGGAFALFPDHGGLVHQQAVVFHQAAVDRRWGFDFLDDAPVLR